MRGYFGLGQLSPSEKSDILDQHRQIYNGYKTMLPQVSNTQPLYTQDYANDKNGITVNNKGEVKHYTNFGINEQHSHNDDSDDFEFESPWCPSCEGNGCEECGGSGMKKNPIEKKEFRPGVDLGKSFERMKHFAKLKKDDEELDEHWQDGDPQYTRLEEAECSECGGIMHEGICNECGSGYMEEETGHLDDIYNEKDFDPTAGFDYIEGSSNDVDTFEKRHKDLYENKELDELGTHELEKGKKYKYNSPSFNDEIEFDDEFDDEKGGEKMFKFKGKNNMGHLMPGKHIEDFVGDLGEQGGNAADMDVDDVTTAFNFNSGGPMDGGDTYPVTEEGNMDDPEITYDTMESAWGDEELDEVDVSGSQGIYADMKPAYDFDSGGAGPAGPYQRRNEHESGYEGEDEDAYWEKDLAPDELDLDLDKFNPEDKSWEEITDYTGDDEFGGVDEDIVESLIIQKNRIMEMMNRMKAIK